MAERLGRRLTGSHPLTKPWINPAGDLMTMSCGFERLSADRTNLGIKLDTRAASDAGKRSVRFAMWAL